MALETATYISDLNAENPATNDPKSQGDDHLRLIKSALKTTFPNITGAVTPTHAELNQVAGVASNLQAQLDTKGAITGQTWTGAHNFSAASLSVKSPPVLPTDICDLQSAQALLSGGGTPANIPITSLGKGTATANQLIRVNAAGTGIEGRPGWLRKTTTYTAASFDRIKCSTTGGAWSLTFPAAPTDGDEIEIQDVNGTFHTNNLTILVNGKKVMGDATSLICDTRYMHVTFVYDATLGDWRF
jgi:hypothetical protein